MATKQSFKNEIEKIYWNKQLHLSQALREELLKTMTELENGDRVSYLAYRLYPHVLKETFSNKADELMSLKKTLEKARWKYYFGEVLGIAFTDFK